MLLFMPVTFCIDNYKGAINDCQQLVIFVVWEEERKTWCSKTFL